MSGTGTPPAAPAQQDPKEALFKGLKDPTRIHLEKAGFDQSLDDATILEAASLFAGNEAALDELVAGLNIVEGMLVKSRIRALAASSVTVAPVSSAQPAAPEAPDNGIEAKFRGGIAALRELIAMAQGKELSNVLDVVRAANTLPWVVTEEDGRTPDPEMTMVALRAAYGLTRTPVSVGGQFNERLVLGVEHFVPVKTDVLTGRAKDETVPYGHVLDALTPDQELFVVYMRGRNLLRKLGSTPTAQADIIKACLIGGQENSEIRAAQVEWRRAEGDPDTLAQLRGTLYIPAPGLGGRGNQPFELQLFAPNADRALTQTLLAMFSASDIRRFVRWAPNGDALTATLPEKGSPMEIAAASVEAFIRSGLIKSVEGFWARLCEERPRRYKEIVNVATQFGFTLVVEFNPPRYSGDEPTIKRVSFK